MRPRKFELRFVSAHRNTSYAANQIGRFFTASAVRHQFWYIPHYDSTIIVFQFANATQVGLAEQLPNLNRELNKLNTKLFNQNSNQNTDHRTAFVNNIHPSNFYCFTTRDGHHCDETLAL